MARRIEKPVTRERVETAICSRAIGYSKRTRAAVAANMKELIDNVFLQLKLKPSLTKDTVVDTVLAHFCISQE